jgi:hypothetical protein
MNHRDLLDKLIRIERAIGVESNLTVHKMLIEAEDCLLELAKERAESLRREEVQSVGDEDTSPEFHPCLPGVPLTSRAYHLLQMMNRIERGIGVSVQEPDCSPVEARLAGQSDCAQERR